MADTLVPILASDDVLLAQYVRDRDQNAFAALVRRHAPLVWSVCRRIVQQHHSAEDAFQATFLVLMQQAARLTLRAKLSTWLYAVAVKVARRSQARDARQQASVNAPSKSMQRAVDQLTVNELIEIIRQEANLLPRRYQPVMDVCFFQQLSISEAAERLGFSTGTVRGLLQRGKKLLQQRLLKRGITPVVLASVSVSSLWAEPVPAASLLASESMVQRQVPEKLLCLLPPPRIVQPSISILALVLLALTGLGWGLLELKAANTPTSFPSISLLNPAKPVDDVYGYVDDHTGKPLAGVSVEVIKEGKVETSLKTNTVGRFPIPDAWKTDHQSNRLLVVRTPGALGWSNRLMYNVSPLQQDIMIKVLPLAAQVQATLTSTDGQPRLSHCDGIYTHIGNGSLDAFNLPPGSRLFQGVMKGNELTLQVPVETTGLIMVNCVNHIEQRIQYIAHGPGQAHAGEVKLQQGGTITGILVDDQGKPVAGAKIVAQEQNRGQQEALYFFGTWAQSYSDAEGRYELNGLEPRLKFNVALYDPLLTSSNRTPLVLVAKEGVELKRGERVDLPLQLQRARQVKGILKEKESGKPIAMSHVGYYGSARPRSSAMIMSETTNDAGEFSFWLPPGTAHLYCCDGTADGNVEITVPEQGDVPPVIISASKKEVNRPYGLVSRSYGTVRFTDDPKKQVQAQPVAPSFDTTQSTGNISYPYEFLFNNGEVLPDSICYRLYCPQKSSPNTGVKVIQQGLLAISDKRISLSIPESSESVTLELDAEGFLPLHWSQKPVVQQEPVQLQLTPAKYLPCGCRVINDRGMDIPGARVQVELKRLGTAIDSPWGPILQTDAAGRCSIKHLRVGDVYRVRVFGPDGKTAVTAWQTMSEKQDELVIKLAP